MIDTIIVEIIPMTVPSSDLLGLICGKILVFPNFFPPKYAEISLTLTKKIVIKTCCKSNTV